MTTLSDLRACKLCGNVFSRRAGVAIVSSCSQCQGISFETIEINKKQAEDDF
jgi:predicted  nucleic acid-binding Zn-ribbon protein